MGWIINYISIGPPDSLKKTIVKNIPNEHDFEPPKERYDKVDSQHKMIIQLNDTVFYFSDC